MVLDAIFLQKGKLKCDLKSIKITDNVLLDSKDIFEHIKNGIAFLSLDYIIYKKLEKNKNALILSNNEILLCNTHEKINILETPGLETVINYINLNFRVYCLVPSDFGKVQTYIKTHQ